MSPEWAGVLVGGGGALTAMWLAARLSNVRVSLSGSNAGIFIPTKGDLAAVILVLTAAAATTIYLIYLMFASIDWPNSSASRWTHPTLSAAEQAKVKAECRMAAYDAIGGGSGKMMDPTPRERSAYVSNCLIANGFKLERIKVENE